MTDYKATPAAWADIEDWANMTDYSTYACILELRARIEALEASTTNQEDFNG